MKITARAGFSSRRATRAALTALLLLGGCGKAPKGQIVAIVNGREISIQQLAAEMEDVPIPASIDRKLLRDTVMQGLVDRELQVEIAHEQGLDKTPEFLALKKRNEEELLASMLGHNVAQAVPVPVDHEIRDFMDSHPYGFTRRQWLLLDQLSFPAPKDRSQLAAVLTDAHSLDAAEAALKSIGIVPVRGQGRIDTGRTDAALAQQIDQAPPGEPILLPQGDQLVVGVITGREPITGPTEVVKLAAARGVRAQTLLHASEAEIAAMRAKAKIEYMPGFEPEATAAKR